MLIDSLLLYESNGIFILKRLRVSAIFYCNNREKVLSTYLDLIQIEKCDAENVVSTFRELLAHNKIDVKNLAEIGNNNGYVMLGKNNGVYSKLKKDVPLLNLIKCACHSLLVAIILCRLRILTNDFSYC